MIVNSIKSTCMLGNFHAFVVICGIFFHFQKILSGTLSQCQTVWIQIRTYVLSVLIWIQTICKVYQQTTKVTTSKERVKCCKNLNMPEQKVQTNVRLLLTDINAKQTSIERAIFKDLSYILMSNENAPLFRCA